MIGNQTAYERLLAGRPNRSWRVQPYTLTDGNLHVAIPARAGFNHIITDVIVTARSDGRAVVDIAGTGGVELLTVQGYYESLAVHLRTHIVAPQGEGITIQRIGLTPATITIVGYDDVAPVVQRVYTVT
jgi:hypothetical protein